MIKPRPTEGNVLYFPKIEIQDSGWLKGALCVWDSIYRIVPQGYKPQDSDEVREAADAGAVRNLYLSPKDLEETRKEYRDFLSAIRFLPDALERPPRSSGMIHREKLDERMVSELTDVLGVITRHGDWLELPRGLADGYMLFLSNTVSKRRSIPKITDSESMFVSMQYFAMQGDMDEFVNPEGRTDMNAALVLQTFAPAGIEEQTMKKVLQFRDANREGRFAFRTALDGLAEELSKVEDREYARDIVNRFMERLQESESLTLARIREYFSDRQSLVIGLGLPLAVTAFKEIIESHNSQTVLGSVGIALISGLAGMVIDCRKNWVPAEASYLAQLREAFVGSKLFPAGVSRLDRLMEEFLND